MERDTDCRANESYPILAKVIQEPSLEVCEALDV
jgi:hypothetical protein